METNNFVILTPCHGIPLSFDYGYEGMPYMQERYVDGFYCSAPLCYNSWDANGQPH